MGDIVIAMNPFVRLPIYTEEILQSYNGTARKYFEGGNEPPAPHVFYTTDTALYMMNKDAKAQSIIISGESGAGKTETAKQVLHFLGSVCGGGSGGGDDGNVSFEEMIISSSPLLEAFGNAKTKKNDNSSRFGKYLSVYIDEKQLI